MKYDSKVSTLEEWNDLDLMTVDELHGIFTTYEMRTRQDGPTKKEATFNASSKNQTENLDDEESLFIKKLEKGTGKYKGKLPLRCFNCERIGNFASKCTQTKQDDSDEKKPQNLKRVKQETRRSPMRKRKLSTPWNIVKIQL